LADLLPSVAGDSPGWMGSEAVENYSPRLRCRQTRGGLSRSPWSDLEPPIPYGLAHPLIFRDRRGRQGLPMGV